jgi:hypothetical protein
MERPLSKLAQQDDTRTPGCSPVLEPATPPTFTVTKVFPSLSFPLSFPLSLPLSFPLFPSLPLSFPLFPSLFPSLSLSFPLFPSFPLTLSLSLSPSILFIYIHKFRQEFVSQFVAKLQTTNFIPTPSPRAPPPTITLTQHPNIVPIVRIDETDKAFYIVCEKQPYTLDTMIQFSPHILETNCMMRPFLMYQLLQVWVFVFFCFFCLFVTGGEKRSEEWRGE